MSKYPYLWALNAPYLKVMMVILAYGATGRLGLSLPFLGSQITLFWLPTGIAVAAILRWGGASWLGIYLGALLVNLAVGGSYPLAAEIAVGNTAAPLFTAWLLKRLGFHSALDRHQDILILCLAAALGMSVSAGNGAFMLWLSGALPSSAVRPAFFSWWMGDFVGVLLAAPLLLTLSISSIKQCWQLRGEFCLWSVLAVILGWSAFFSGLDRHVYPFAFLSLPLAVWAALRFGSTGGAFATLLLTFLAILGTSIKGDPFPLLPQHQGLLLLWAYMVTLLLVNLMVMALLAERRLAEQALQASEARLRALFNTAAIGIVVIDERGLIEEFNQGSQAIFGYAKDEVMAKNINILMPEPHQSQHDGYMSHYLAGGQGKVIGVGREVVGLHKSGSVFPMELYVGEALFSNHRAYIGFVRDITQRKQRDADTKRYEAIVQSSTDAIISKTMDGIISSWNPGAEAVFGYRADEMIGRSMTKLFPPDRLDEEKLILERIALGERVEHFETVRSHKNGAQIHLSVTISPIYDEANNIIGASKVARNITERKLAEDKIHDLAFYDPLTKLPNRLLLKRYLKHAIANSARLQKYGALLFIDLDNFKILNDTQGHQVGDELLVQAAMRLQECVREIDTVARLGGDEFVVLLDELDETRETAIIDVKLVAEKVNAALGRLYQLSAIAHSCTSSIGITLFMGPDATVDTVLLQADTAMYEAKKRGKNAYRFFDSEMQETLGRRVAMESALRGAVTAREFCLYYQPQVNNTGLIVGAEALIRWLRPGQGAVPPSVFIPLAEESDIIQAIGGWVLATACAQLSEWQRRPEARALTLAVNVSAKQFYQPGFVQQVEAILRQHAIDPGKLELELTESLVLDDIDDTILKMQALRKLGVRFSMDDFGTGYSSLSNLKKLPFNQLKIDQSFICELSTNPDDAVIVQTIIAMAGNLGMEVIAEGVETKEQRDFLEQHGCLLFQGYLFSKPVPILHFDALLKQG